MLKSHFHTLGNSSDLVGTIESGRFTRYAPWDKMKPCCKVEVVGENLSIDLD